MRERAGVGFNRHCGGSSRDVGAGRWGREGTVRQTGTEAGVAARRQGRHDVDREKERLRREKEEE